MRMSPLTIPQVSQAWHIYHKTPRTVQDAKLLLVWMERNFPGFQMFGKFHTAILMGIFTMNLADGWTDRTDDGHTDRQMEFQVE